MSDIRLESVERLEMLMPVFLEALAEGKTVRFSPRGKSMLPMIREGIDSVVIAPVGGRLKKYDLPLYQRDNGKYILHRIVAVGENYTCMGDNQFVPEPQVRQDQLIAVVCAFYRGEKCYRVDSFRYRLYCHFWHYTRPLRHLWQRGKNWLRRHLGGSGK